MKLSYAAALAIYVSSVACQPFPTSISVDPGGGDIRPYFGFVKQGSWTKLSTKVPVSMATPTSLPIGAPKVPVKQEVRSEYGAFEIDEFAGAKKPSTKSFKVSDSTITCQLGVLEKLVNDSVERSALLKMNAKQEAGVLVLIACPELTNYSREISK